MWIALGFVIIAALTDEDEPPVAALVLFFGLCLLFAILQFGSFTVGRLEKENIKRTGIPAKAVILSVSETGTRLNDQPLLKIEPEVQPPYDSRFTTTVEYIVPYLESLHLQPGKKVPVYYIDGTTEVALADP
jgi:hypothetical protein